MLRYECDIIGDDTPIWSGFVTKKFRRSDTPNPYISPDQYWSLPKIFEIFKREKKISEGGLKKIFFAKRCLSDNLTL